jgi:hypothetical protein
MKKNRLEIDYTYDFNLFGVIASVKGYTLAWELNRRLDINLVKQPDLVVGFKNTGEKAFSFFAFETLLNRLKLFKNKPSENEGGKYFLIPEFPHYDFIILAAMEEPDANTKLIDSVKDIPSVQFIAPIPMEGLKSKANFIF